MPIAKIKYLEGTQMSRTQIRNVEAKTIDDLKGSVKLKRFLNTSIALRMAQRTFCMVCSVSPTAVVASVMERKRHQWYNGSGNYEE